jgi:predicted RNA-binding Zn-ribbon protein involved in translation (DUF1610 family)
MPLPFNTVFVLGPTLILIGIIIFFALLIVGVLVIGFAWRYWADKKLKAYCEKNGFIFYGKNIPHAQGMIKGSALDRGHSQKMFYGIGRKHQGLDMITFQWQFTVGHGKHSHTYTYKIAMMPENFRESGFIYIRKEGLMDKLGGVFGLNDLDFEHQKFSDKFYVKANPQKYGYDFFNPRMIELFMKYGAYDMIVRNSIVMIYQQGSMGGMGMIFKLKGGRNPFEKWMGGSANMLSMIHSRVPKFMLIRRGRKLEDDDPDEDVVMGQVAEERDIITAEKLVTIVCPACSEEFKIRKGKKRISCPSCGTEGEL